MMEIDHQLTPKTVLIVLGGVISALVLLNLAGDFSTYALGHGHLYGLIPLFDLNREANIPTLFEASILLFAALLLMVISVARKRTQAADQNSWRCLALIFSLLAIDEACAIHELFTAPLRESFGLGGIFYYAWVIPGMLLVAILGVRFLKWLLGLPRSTRNLFLLAAVMFIGGAIGIELIGSYVDASGSRHTLLYRLLIAVEESLEMTGVAVFIFGLLGYMRDELGG